MKIYTRGGDDGETGLYGPGRVKKYDPRLEAYGAVDELNCALGVAAAGGLAGWAAEFLEAVQHELFILGGELATRRPSETALPRVSPAMTQRLENWIDAWEAELPPLTQFILPGGSPAGAHLHLARAVCRRAERRTAALADEVAENDEPISPAVIVYLNRLSDALFVAARRLNAQAEAPERTWRKPAE